MSWYRRSSIVERLERERKHSSTMILFPPKRKSTSRDLLSILDTDDETAMIEELSKMVPGMENCTFEPTTVSPPPLPQLALNEENSTDSDSLESFLGMKVPSNEELSKALLELESSNCPLCRSSPRITLVNVDYCPRYRYTLESFTERRQISWSFEPYTGLALDGPDKGHVPDIWSIECPCPVPFKSSSMMMELPHTDCLCNCCACGGTGRKRCNVCDASGWEKCSFCVGYGFKTGLQGYRDRCHECIGSGRKKCWRCDGDGMAVCHGCGGTGQIRCFIALTINWFKHADETIDESLPKLKEKLLLSQGHLIFEEMGQQVSPVTNFYEPSICEGSTKLVEKHKEFLIAEKLHQQRQKLEGIPVSQILYLSQGRMTKQCVLYGTNNLVFSTDENARFCCFLV